MLAKILLINLLVLSYNPYDVFLINFTELGSAQQHIEKLWFGLFLVFIFSLHRFSSRFVVIITSSFLFGIFAVVNTNGDVIYGLADYIFLFEYVAFFMATSFILRSISVTSFLRIFFSYLLVVSAGNLILFYLLNDLYSFRLNFGGHIVHRNIDLIAYFLLFLAIVNPGGIFSRLVVNMGLLLSAMIVLLTFMRGLYIAVLLPLVFTSLFYRKFLPRNLRFNFGFSVNYSNLLIFFILIIAAILYSLAQGFDPLILLDRIGIDNEKESSVSGRLNSYYYLFTGALGDPLTLFLGHGPGSLFPPYNLPVSSAPSNFLGILYIFGLPIFIIFCFILWYIYTKAFVQVKLQAGLDQDLSYLFILLLLSTVVILNIFPAPLHFPVYGFVAIFHALICRKRMGAEYRGNPVLFH